MRPTTAVAALSARVLGVLSLLAWSACAVAQTSASASVSLPFNVSSLEGPPSSCSATANPAACALAGDIGYNNANGSASATAAYGSLSVSTALGAIGDHYGGEGTVTAQASASFSDTMTIQNAPTAGTLVITWNYSEQTQVACAFGPEVGCVGSAALLLTGAPSNPVTSSSVANPTLYPAGSTTQSSGSFVEDLPYSSSQANLYFLLTASSSCQVTGFGGEYCDSTSSSSLQIAAIQVLDGGGNVMPAADIAAASEVVFSTVPLPASVWLLLSALGGLALMVPLFGIERTVVITLWSDESWLNQRP